jgi:hypothetical protein
LIAGGSERSGPDRHVDLPEKARDARRTLMTYPSQTGPAMQLTYRKNF